MLWCLKQPDLYGPGLAAHGLDPARLVLATARRDDELLWAVEEGLRTPGLGAVVGEVGRLPLIAGRRLQLAAERSGVTLLLVRRWRGADEAAAERVRPSAAVTRWRIAALPSATPSLILPREPGREHKITLPRERGREGWGLAAGSARWVGKPRWRVELVRCRGGQAPAQWDVEVADATGHVSLSAELADRPAAPQRRRREPRRRLAG